MSDPHLNFGLDVLHLAVQLFLFLDHHVALGVMCRVLHHKGHVYLPHIHIRPAPKVYILTLPPPCSSQMMLSIYLGYGGKLHIPHSFRYSFNDRWRNSTLWNQGMVHTPNTLHNTCSCYMLRVFIVAGIRVKVFSALFKCLSNGSSVSFPTSEICAAARIFLSSVRFLLMIMAIETGLSPNRV